MSSSQKLLPPLVSSAVALIVVTNYCIVTLLHVSGLTARAAIGQILAMGVPASLAVILVMSALYHALQDAVSGLEQSRSELLRRAQRDALTNVASREFFEEQLAQSLDQFRQNGAEFAVIMIDLDDFKRVNDLHGHHVGDALLREVSGRLSLQLEHDDTIARLGGDEFVILTTSSSTDGVRRNCERICAAMGEPYNIDTLQLRVTASLGAIVAHDTSHDIHDYLRSADMALYHAKAEGRNCYRFFSVELDDALRRRDRLETDLRVAIQSGRGVEVHFQPQIDAYGALTGVEALFRWRHPLLGDVPAAEAVEIAESSDLILELGEFVFRRAAEFARAHSTLSVAINLSPAQFTRSIAFVERLRELACEEGINPEQLELEITERMFMDIGCEFESQIQALRRSGFRIALDDFGTGYSSLSYLRRFQVDRLKLDKSFAEETELNESIAIIRAAVALAHLLGLEVIAEGIETTTHEAIALESGCDGLQGHHYGAAMSAEDFEVYLDERCRKVA